MGHIVHNFPNYDKHESMRQDDLYCFMLSAAESESSK